MEPRNVDLRTEDGLTLRGSLYDGGGEEALAIAGAMGVKRRYYDAFARSAAERGISVVTFDYRGIGDSRPKSLRGFGGSMRDWGRYDIDAALGFALDELKPRRLLYLGHSAGGQLIGYAPRSTAIAKIVLVAAQSGYWRHWPGIRAYGLGLLWLVMPPISSLIGFFPARLFRLGSEDLPRNVAAEWARFGRHPEYVFSGANEEQLARYAAIAAPILAWSFEDDRYAPRKAVEALLLRYRGSAIEHRHVEPRRIGHFGFFRRNLGESLWTETFDWLQ